MSTGGDSALSNRFIQIAAQENVMPRLNERILSAPEKDFTTFVGLVGREAEVDAESVNLESENSKLALSN